MSGLLHTLNMGSESLFATRQGVDTTAHNIANAQKEGYSRQRVNLETRHPIFKHGNIIGNGAFVGTITRSHDKLVESQLVNATSQQGYTTSKQEALMDIENIFSPEYGNSIDQEISGFFDSLNTLANFPEELTTRTAVYENAKNLSSSIRNIDSQLKRSRSDLNESLMHSSHMVSNNLAEISKINVQIGNMETGMRNEANDLRDKRDELIREIAEKMDITYYEDPRGMTTIRGPGDDLLVEAGRAVSLDVRLDGENSSMYDIVISDFEGQGSKVITDKIRSGSMHGLIEARDVTITGLIDNNNQMAMSLANKFNAIHRQGFGIGDFRESAGRDFFEEISDLDSAASRMHVSSGIEASVDAIAAASTPNAPGDNIVVNELVKLKSAKILNDNSASLNEYYSNYVGELGLEVVRTKHSNDANNILKSNVETLKNSISGVSLDEEAANMIKWQTAFTASSKVITTVDEMLETVLGLKR